MQKHTLLIMHRFLGQVDRLEGVYVHIFVAAMSFAAASAWGNDPVAMAQWTLLGWAVSEVCTEFWRANPKMMGMKMSYVVIAVFLSVRLFTGPIMKLLSIARDKFYRSRCYFWVSKSPIKFRS